MTELLRQKDIFCTLAFYSASVAGLTIIKYQHSSKPSTLFPNPNNGNSLTIRYQFKEPGSIKIEIVNMAGTTILRRQLSLKNTTLLTTSTIDLSGVKMTPGMYLVRISNGKEMLTGKLILSK